MSNFVDDLDVVDETVVVDEPSYPLAQWLNGDPKLAAAGGVAHTGGVILPVKHLDEDVKPAPSWTTTTVTFANGKSEAALASQKVALAVVRTRFRWRAQQNGATTYLPRTGYVGGAGLRGNLQVLCGIYGYAFPVVVTFTGRASQEFERLSQEFNNKLVEAARRLGIGKAGSNGHRPPRLPRFAFYMKLVPGPHQKAGQKGTEAIITPPMLHLPQEVTPDYLSAAYVGRERLLELQQLYHDAADWAGAWDHLPHSAHNGSSPDDAGEAE
ncbi:MAG: hypothetical protein IT317_10670 [Anaerolineales bacterium]|nr:hypothetical protein [Anaerolineales bacterium]